LKDLNSSISKRFLISLEKESWYHGDLSREAALNFLKSAGSIDGYANFYHYWNISKNLTIF
jgi:hypothetical protein